MIRPFDWRDLTLLHRVRHRGLCLDSQLAYTRGPNVLQYALLDMLNPGRTAHTLVLRPGAQASIGQVLLPAGRNGAHIAFISPAEVLEDKDGVELLEALARAAGEHGAHSLIAEVDEDSPGFESLRRSGFAIYSRQRIWQLTGLPAPSDAAKTAGASRVDRRRARRMPPSLPMHTAIAWFWLRRMASNPWPFLPSAPERTVIPSSWRRRLPCAPLSIS